MPWAASNWPVSEAAMAAGSSSQPEMTGLIARAGVPAARAARISDAVT
tara:strand:- start:412 stop:555 length:144 start_codon:yes stop_codon:yes gene_type:complete